MSKGAALSGATPIERLERDPPTNTGLTPASPGQPPPFCHLPIGHNLVGLHTPA
jgi:hypothetical protein